MNRSAQADPDRHRDRDPDQPESFVLTAQRFWDGTSDTLVGPVEVFVRGRTITAVGERLARPRGTPVVDLGDRTLLPGFIDCHVHVVQAAVGTSTSAQTLAALPALRSLLANGFTTVRDLGCTEQSITVDLRQAQRDGIVPGPAMLVAPHILSARGGHGDKSGGLATQFGLEVGSLADGVGEILRTVRAEVRLGGDWVKFAATGGFSSADDDPEQITYTQDEMNALVAAARDLGRPCATHAFGDEGVRRAIRAGVRSVEHAALASAETLALMADHGTWLVPTNGVTVSHVEHLDDDAFWADKPAYFREKMSKHEDQLRRTAATPVPDDVRLAFGSDAGILPHRDNWREFTAMVSTGIPPLRALRAATTEAAALLGLSDRGAVRPGLLADLVAVPGNPLDDIAVTGDVDFVMQHGTVVIAPEAVGHDLGPADRRNGGIPSLPSGLVRKAR